MARKFDSMLGAAAALSLLTSCGGSPTPSPTPTPTGTPTPTPTASATPVVYDFTQNFDQLANALVIYANFTPTGGAEVFSDSARIQGGSRLAYTVTPERVQFAFQDLQDAIEFLGTDLTGSSANQRSYAKGDTALTLEVPFANVLRATYARNDPFSTATATGTLRSYRVALFPILVSTTTGITANLTYSGTARLAGGTPGQSAPGALTSNAQTLTVTAGTTPTISGTIPVFETVGAVTTQRAALAFTANLSANGSFSGTMTDATGGFTGSVSGALAGPNREEVYLVLAASHTDGRKLVGSYIGD